MNWFKRSLQLLAALALIATVLFVVTASRQWRDEPDLDAGPHEGPPRSCDSVGGDVDATIDACTLIIQADDAREDEVERALLARALAYEQSGDSMNAERDRELVKLLKTP